MSIPENSDLTQVAPTNSSKPITASGRWGKPVDKSFLPVFKKLSWRVIVVASLFQMFLLITRESLFAIFCVITGWYLVDSIFLKPRVLKNYPFSTFLILGFCLTQLYFPLVFTILEGKSIIYNLKLPIDVFLHAFLALLVIVFVHFFYRTYTRNRTFNAKKSTLYRIGLFEPPSQKQLWLMGFIGLLATFYIYFLSSAWVNGDSGSPVDKFIKGFFPFAYAPFFIPFSTLFGGKKVDMKKLWPKLAVFTFLLFLLSIIRNSRGAFMVGFTSLGFSYLLGLLLGVFIPKFFSTRNVIIGAVGFWLLIGPLSDLGTAMVIVRSQRYSVSPIELLTQTISTLFDQEQLNDFRRENSGTVFSDEWDEGYLNNLFLARFCNLKFNDNSLSMAGKLGHFDPVMQKFQLDRLLSIFPQPMLDVLRVDIDKAYVSSSSIGDVFYYQTSSSDISALGQYKGGHFEGTGLAGFGWWYLAIIGVLILPTFYLMDKFVFIKTTIVNEVQGALIDRKMVLSFAGLLNISFIFTFLANSEGVLDIGSFIIRGWLQIVLLYIVVLKFTGFLSKLLSK